MAEISPLRRRMIVDMTVAVILAGRPIGSV
jgi:hypothetical protein